MLLMLDNYDSFTFNLVQYLQELGAEVRVERNDALTVEQIARLAPQRIVISPGPCTPNEAGICLELLERLGKSGAFPILGVCLGHQHGLQRARTADQLMGAVHAAEALGVRKALSLAVIDSGQ